MSENLTVKILEVSGLAIAAQYVGLPVGKIMPRDAVTTSSGVLTRESLRRLNRLIAKGDEHAKIMRQVVVHMEITAPRYWWQQFACYHPEGFLQTRLIMVSYQALRRMWLQRQNHKLPEWHSFLETLENLPHSNELIFVKQLDTT